MSYLRVRVHKNRNLVYNPFNYKKVKTPLCDKVIVLHFITTRASTLWVSSGNDKYHANIEVYTDVKPWVQNFLT